MKQYGNIHKVRLLNFQMRKMQKQQHINAHSTKLGECGYTIYGESYTIISKANFLCNDSRRNSLLEHGFWPVKTRLLISYGTAVYAIINVNT